MSRGLLGLPTEVWNNNASYESRSVFVFRLFSCDLENTKIEEVLKSGKK